MLDRASTFANEEMNKMLRDDFVAVAIDQAYERRQDDAKGEFYRRIASQGPRSGFKHTTQGFYVATAAGELLLYNNNRDPAKVRRLVRGALERFRLDGGNSRKTEAIEAGELDPRFSPVPPAGGLVVRVNARVLAGYPAPRSAWDRIQHSALSRDNLWITKAEHDALAKGRLTDALVRRLVRFHLVDGTRGEPPMWRDGEVRSLEVELERGQLRGTVHLETKDGSRGYRARVLGFVEQEKGRVCRFDAVFVGSFWGEGRYTSGAPAGEFPLAVRFTLADGIDTADAIPPQGSRGWLRGYLR